jgi:hypothetical protein
MYVARGGGGAGSWRTGERHEVIIFEIISWVAINELESRWQQWMAESDSEEMYFTSFTK